ncbi:hypothetical protein AKJ57_04160, partial [candidate division MSBL1 archaeon SCGC-AAA259A05]
MSGSEITRFPDVYRRSVKKISSYPSGDQTSTYVENVEKFIEYMKDSGELIWVGTGRQEEIADFATRLIKANDIKTSCSKDSSIHYEYDPGNLVIALSSSGETTRTIHYAESAYKRAGCSVPVIAITGKPNSTLAKIAEKTGGFVVKVPGKSKEDTKEYQEKQFLGKHQPLTLSGTLGELYSLEFILDAIGSYTTGYQTMRHHKKFWRKIESYEPDPEQFKRLYKLLPNPIDYKEVDTINSFNKTITCGLGLSGVIARSFAIRLAHCADKGEERRVSYYKDAGNIVS